MVRLGALLAAGFLILGACGCSEKRKVRAAIESEYAKGNYEESVALCERAIESGIVEADVFLLCGLSLLSLDRDTEALERLSRAVSMDRVLGPEVSAHLLAKAQETLSGGKAVRAGRLARAASEYNSKTEAGPLEYLVAESFFDEKRWEEAAAHYKKALDAYPDTSAAEKGYYNLAACYAATSDSAAAIETLEKQMAEFPRGALASEAEWTLVNLIYDRARSAFQRGDYERAAALAVGIIGRTENGIAAQRARLLLGESYERMGDYASAYEQYESVVRADQGASGPFVERARARMRAIRDAGLR